MKTLSFLSSPDFARMLIAFPRCSMRKLKKIQILSEQIRFIVVLLGCLV